MPTSYSSTASVLLVVLANVFLELCNAEGEAVAVIAEAEREFARTHQEDMLGAHLPKILKIGLVGIAVLVVSSCVLGLCVGIFFSKTFQSCCKDPIWRNGKSSQALSNSYQVVSRVPIVKKT
eukprot:jgi/Bigna1/130520/aug1.11_g5228